MLALKKLAGNKIEVTEADLQKGFESAYGERVMAKLILFDDIRRAQDVAGLVKTNPNDFEKLAQEHSVEPTSRSMGGTIPPIRKHGGNKELEDKAFAMKAGEISPIIQVGAGRYAILKCEGRTQTQVKAMTPEIRKELYGALVEEKTQEVVANVFTDLKDKSRVDNYLKGTVNVGNIQPVSHEAPGTARTGTASTQQPGTQQPQTASPGQGSAGFPYRN
jgi:foldase protein PrsA